MAQNQFSPGVVAIENEQPIINNQPVQVGAAIIGPTVKGPVEIPTVVTTYSEYISKFGDVFISGSQTYSYLTSISAYNYFAGGGTTLLVTRVTSGSFTPASSSNIPNSLESGVISTDLNALSGSLTLVTGSAGTYTISGSGGTGTLFTGSITLTSGTGVSSITATSGTGYLIGDIITIPSQSLGYGAGVAGTDMLITLTADDIVNQNAFTLETLSEGIIMNSTSTLNSDGSLASGSVDNLRYQIFSPDTDTGTFSLLIRKGDDDTANPVVLETWNDLSLDPISSNYIEKVIGNQVESVIQDGSDYYLDMTGNYSNQSNYVRVKQVNYKTPNYLDNAGDPKPEYTSSIPITSSGTFGGAEGSNIPNGVGNYYENIDDINTQGLIPSDYDQSISLLANTDEFKYQYISTPGLIKKLSTHSSALSTLVSNCQQRGDTMAIIDLVAYQSPLIPVTSTAKSIDSSYAAAYWPWILTLDPSTGQQIWVPASTMMPGVYAYNDASAEVWSAPAGTLRGLISNAIRAERKLTKNNRDDLYKANVNPITTSPNSGIVIFGQKTLKKKLSATDRVGVRRLLIELKTQISNVAENLVFEQNTIATRNDFLSQVNPYLSSVQQRQGLTDYQVIMDDSNNTPNVIDNNQLIGAIYIQPTRTAEFISLSFNITPTGATFT